MVAAKIAVSPTESAREVTEAIDAAEVRVRAALPVARLIFLDPDIARASETISETSPETAPVD
jgi:hypothetical protein